MVTVLGVVDDSGEFAKYPAINMCVEDCGDLVVGESSQTS